MTPAESTTFYGTGRRKTAAARVFIRPGTGTTIINGREIEEYIPNKAMRNLLEQPMVATETYGKFDIRVTVRGGGLASQAGAIRHGIARALLVYNVELRKKLRAGGYLTRDSRKKERKKYGQKGARKRFQFSKR